MATAANKTKLPKGKSRITNRGNIIAVVIARAGVRLNKTQHGHSPHGGCEAMALKVYVWPYFSPPKLLPFSQSHNHTPATIG